MQKQRLDTLLVEKGFFPSREKAKASIMAGVVFVDNQKVDKAGEEVKVEAIIEVRENICPYVSRGGLKLEKAVNEFNLILSGKICMDMGASTGGFTDCMLKNGAVKVYAVDVGYGQLDWKLRTDERVVCMERTNVRYLTENEITEKLDFVSIDVSFISLTKVLPVAYNLTKETGEVVALIKPQFEARREQVGKKGVIKDPLVHKEVIEKVIDFSKELGFKIKNLSFSPIKGPEGNIEFLLYLSKQEENEYDVDSVVKSANDTL
ncbi:MAG: TlyA family RNA methyltransferase [Clostridia bacterium]|nr:TlyA family RNA methyltransferase [Clostridia bacterium]